MSDFIPGKVPFIGLYSVGKTSIILRYNKKIQRIQATTDCRPYQIEVNAGIDSRKISIWDTAGTEKYQSLIPHAIRGAELVVLVCSQDEPKSFEYIKEWHQKLIDEYGISKFIIVCNKLDIEEDSIPSSAVKEWATKNKLRMLRTSVKENKNIDNLFISIASMIEKQPDEEAKPLIGQKSCC